MKIIFIIILIIHGLIHSLGFFMAFGIFEISELSNVPSKFTGILWLLTVLMFLAVSILFLLKNDMWLLMAIAAISLSQILIMLNWSDAKFGTLPNVLLFFVILIAIAAWNFEENFKRETLNSFENSSPVEEILSEKDMEHLPMPVQKYLRYVGVVGKPKVKNVRVIFKGEMREEGKDWFRFTSEQYNFFEEPTRLFFMKARFKGLPTAGFHSYKGTKAYMKIKLLSLFSVVSLDEPELFKTETVTYFNDLCMFAPAALVDKKIRWEAVSDSSVKAIFTNKNTTISAMLYFDGAGRLTNFISEDRMDISSNKTIPFSTPVTAYGTINGYTLPVSADAVWHYPERDFVYGRFNLQHVEYNLVEVE